MYIFRHQELNCQYSTINQIEKITFLSSGFRLLQCCVYFALISDLVCLTSRFRSPISRVTEGSLLEWGPQDSRLSSELSTEL